MQKGKVALITGGNSGIGLARAKQFVNEGAYVFITGRREAELTAAKKQIGKNVTAIQNDVSNLDDLDRWSENPQAASSQAALVLVLHTLSGCAAGGQSVSNSRLVAQR
jgi:NADP-dependent 3-hydroxy acid dehydrogenase YdfG